MADWLLETGLHLLGVALIPLRGVVLLDLCDTQVADAGAAELKQALPEWDVVRWP